MTPTLHTSQPGRHAFHDSLGYYPGIEALPMPIRTYSDTQLLRLKPYAFTDIDASTVVPAAGYYPPRTPAGFTGLGGETSPPSANVSSCETFFFITGVTASCVSIGAVGETEVTGAQSGNPGDTGVQFGYHFEVAGAAPDGSWGRIRLWRAAEAAEAGARIAPDSDTALVATAGVVNTGGAVTITLYSDFDELSADLVADSWTAGVVPVDVSAEQVAELVRTSGPAALESLRVPPEQATALAWAGHLGSGSGFAFDYELSPRSRHAVLSTTTSAFGSGSEVLDTATARLSLVQCVYLPSLGTAP
jgi:hypothetical protein